MRRRGASLVLVAALLAACSTGAGSSRGSGGDAGAPGTQSAGPTSVVRPVQDDQAARLQALAVLAEQAAAELPAPRTPKPRQAGKSVLGADISWPQCPPGLGIPERRTLGMPMPIAQAEYVVVGLTNGPGFTENPCLGDQVAWVRERGLMAAAYAVASWPGRAAVAEHGASGPYDGATRLGALANTGYHQALYAVAAMRRAGLRSPLVWVDVEPVRDFEWSADPTANAAVVEGAVKGYRAAGYDVGVYSTPYLWSQIVGGLRLGLPEWRAAGETSAEEALRRCGAGESIQGGEAVLGQWVQDRRDQNLTCPGVAADLGRWFHQY